jgi:hypothetical protein
MLRTAPALAAALLVTLLTSVLSPCPGLERSSLGPGLEAGSVHAASARAETASPSATGWCHGARPRAELRALCVCGCSERPSAAGVPTAFGWALLPSAPALVQPLLLRRSRSATGALPDSAAEPIEHVPLPA